MGMDFYTITNQVALGLLVTGLLESGGDDLLAGTISVQACVLSLLEKHVTSPAVLDK